MPVKRDAGRLQDDQRADKQQHEPLAECHPGQELHKPVSLTDLHFCRVIRSVMLRACKMVSPFRRTLCPKPSRS